MGIKNIFFFVNAKIKYIATLFDMIKVSHAIFSMPFALLVILLAAPKSLNWSKIFFIVVTITAARTAAMVFNRFYYNYY